MMEFTRAEIKDAALVLVVNEAGEFKWSSTKPPRQVITMLRSIADEVVLARPAQDEGEGKL